MEEVEKISDTNKEILKDLMLQKIEIAYNMIRYYILATTIFITVIGFLLKFAFDKNSTPELKTILLFLGIVVCFGAMVLPYFGERFRENLHHDIEGYRELLDLPQQKENLMVLRHIIITYSIIDLICLCGFIFLFFQYNII